MDDFAIARALHIVAVVIWVGGVAFVTMTVVPAIRAGHPPQDRLAAFQRFERIFVWQARASVLLAGASGFWMLWRGELWQRLGDIQFWWMHAMIGMWLVFTVLLFVIEPLYLHRQMAQSRTPATDFDRLATMHRVLLALLLATIAGASLGARGVL